MLTRPDNQVETHVNESVRHVFTCVVVYDNLLLIKLAIFAKLWLAIASQSSYFDGIM